MDAYYRSALIVNPSLDLKAAGFIEDPFSDWRTLPDSLKWSSATPTFKLEIRPFETNYVLVATGCFAPIHEGHLSAMDAAKHACILQGRHIAGGYFAIANDSYITEKLGPDTPYSQDCRLAIAREATKKHWCMIDPWISLCEKDVNFTVYLERLTAYLSKLHPFINFEPILVVGSDRVNFLDAFCGKGHAICVARSTSDIPAVTKKVQALNAIRKDTALAVLDTISEQSSSSVRLQPTPVQFAQGTYFIRDDMPTPELSLALKQALDFVFRGHNIRTCIIPLSEQRHLVNKLRESLKRQKIKLLSLDPFIDADAFLKVSRVFQSGGNQSLPITLQESPEAQPLKTQIANLTPGRYVLIDDDIVSGYTIDLIKGMLPPTVRIVEEISLLRLWWTHFGDTPLDLYDIIDARDFATNQAYGGLVIQDPSVSSPIRAPYTDVRVNLATRAKLAPYQIKPFKDELQKLRQTTEISAVTPLSNMV